MEGIGVVMPVENDMRKPQHFLGCPGVLNTAMITVVVLYAVIGFFGYVRYGDGVRGIYFKISFYHKQLVQCGFFFFRKHHFEFT